MAQSLKSPLALYLSLIHTPPDPHPGFNSMIACPHINKPARCRTDRKSYELEAVGMKLDKSCDRNLCDAYIIPLFDER